MREIYKNALSEVSAIINNSEENVINKIPDRFLNFVNQNMNKSYTVELQNDKGILEQDISKEAKSIIALIYRDYICSSSERKELIHQEIKHRREEEERKKEMYKIKWYHN